jgi:ferric-dicitrate binding protein FerR (iron transport regulator)
MKQPMEHNKENAGRLLDRAVDGLRKASATPEQVSQASANVLMRLRGEVQKVVPHPSSGTTDRIQSCEDFRGLIPAYLTSSLAPARRLLFEDHVRECAGCRRALENVRRGAPVGTSTAASPRGFQTRHLRWVAAAAAVLAVGVALQTTPVRDLLWPVDVHAVVRSIDGDLVNVSGQNSLAMKAGERVERGEIVRTGFASGAMLELPDGTRVEMAARSELSLGRGRDGLKIELNRGNVIVSAAKQHGHLYVETVDLSVAVVGTVFAVEAGIKGSRVAVVEGQVRVQHAGVEQALLPGQQTVSDPAMGEVPIAEQIVWSRNAEEWMKELTAFGQDFARRAENASMRYTSNLVPLAPADTLVLAALPNVTQPFKESYSLFQQRVGENASLADWWRGVNSPVKGISMNEFADRIAEVGAYLGPEVVLAVPKETNGRQPLFVAEATQQETLISAIEGDLRRLADVNGAPSEFRLARNAAELAAASGSDPLIYVGDGLMVVSDPAQVRQTVAVRQQRVANAFAGTPLYRRLEQVYRDGAGWLLAIDVRQIFVSDDPVPAQLGFDNVQQLVLEQRTGVGNAASRVTLGFDQERRGMAAWLGSPAPMGALDFVSQDAYGFSAWVVKDPELILNDILALAQSEPDILLDLQKFELTHGIDIRRDLAEPLGNEILIAVDGPILPTPSWKVVLEVDNGPRLENAIQFAVTNVNRLLAAQGKPTITLASETVEGKTYHSLKSEGNPVEVHYTFWTGYMIVAPSRALLTEAIRVHDSGISLVRSTAFRAQLPPDGRDVASAIMYQNLEAMAQAVPSVAADAMSNKLQDQVRQAAILYTSMPKVAFVYGEQDRIEGTAKGSFGINIASMLGLHSMLHAAGFGNPQ